MPNDADGNSAPVGPGRVMRITAWIAAVLAVAGALALPATPAPTHPCVSGNELLFRAADGTKLVGHRFGGTRPGARTAVVLAHMSVGDLCQWVPYARGLARKGFFVFPFDLRGHGFSEGRQDHARAGADVSAAVRAVRGLGARKVVVVGASLGGIAAVIATAAAKPALDGLVAVSAPVSIAGELNAMPAAQRLRVPTLYVAAEQDQSPPYDFTADAQRLYDATGTTQKRLELLSGSLHGVFLVEGSGAVRKLLLAFVRDPRAAVRG
jgi:alpha-beta hydrolase superfamily lysophospholipase